MFPKLVSGSKKSGVIGDKWGIRCTMTSLVENISLLILIIAIGLTILSEIF